MQHRIRFLGGFTSQWKASGIVSLALCALCLFLGACGTTDHWRSSSLATLSDPSPNWGERRFDLIVLHHTGEASFANALAVLTNPKSGVSAHYLISRDGLIAQLVDERERAWHAGVSHWGPIDDVNSASIGIELDNSGDEPFADAQIDALLALLGDLTRRYGIDPRHVIGHADVAPARKSDPGWRFPWARLAEHGYGLWCNQPAEPPLRADSPNEADALRLIGYRITDEAGVAPARHAFKLHFLGTDDSQPLNAAERNLLLCIARAASTSAPPGIREDRSLRPGSDRQ